MTAVHFYAFTKVQCPSVHPVLRRAAHANTNICMTRILKIRKDCMCSHQPGDHRARKETGLAPWIPGAKAGFDKQIHWRIDTYAERQPY